VNIHKKRKSAKTEMAEGIMTYLKAEMAEAPVAPG
jgi:hypothetical protein